MWPASEHRQLAPAEANELICGERHNGFVQMILPARETEELVNAFRHFAFPSHPGSKTAVAKPARAYLPEPVNHLGRSGGKLSVQPIEEERLHRPGQPDHYVRGGLRPASRGFPENCR